MTAFMVCKRCGNKYPLNDNETIDIECEYCIACRTFEELRYDLDLI
jgi:hypothetical protein